MVGSDGTHEPATQLIVTDWQSDSFGIEWRLKYRKRQTFDVAAGHAWTIYGNVFYDVYIECNSIQDIHGLKLTVEGVNFKFKKHLERLNNEANFIRGQDRGWKNFIQASNFDKVKNKETGLLQVSLQLIRSSQFCDFQEKISIKKQKANSLKKKKIIESIKLAREAHNATEKRVSAICYGLLHMEYECTVNLSDLVKANLIKNNFDKKLSPLLVEIKRETRIKARKKTHEKFSKLVKGARKLFQDWEEANVSYPLPWCYDCMLPIASWSSYFPRSPPCGCYRFDPRSGCFVVKD